MKKNIRKIIKHNIMLNSSVLAEHILFAEGIRNSQNSNRTMTSTHPDGHYAELTSSALCTVHFILLLWPVVGVRCVSLQWPSCPFERCQSQSNRCLIPSINSDAMKALDFFSFFIRLSVPNGNVKIFGRITFEIICVCFVLDECNSRMSLDGERFFCFFAFQNRLLSGHWTS